MLGGFTQVVSSSLTTGCRQDFGSAQKGRWRQHWTKGKRLRLETAWFVTRLWAEGLAHTKGQGCRQDQVYCGVQRLEGQRGLKAHPTGCSSKDFPSLIQLPRAFVGILPILMSLLIFKVVVHSVNPVVRPLFPLTAFYLYSYHAKV